MATLSHADTRRMYSWWWDSHISPKNSKWLQENLTDMDAKVKAMIKLIEEDADSFARRAEMYYKKRPELMKFVEEFYRAYRALAERYDHATGILRQAHWTMSEAFPNQIPMAFADDSPAVTAEADPSTPEMPHPTRAFSEPDELQKDALGLSSAHFYATKRNGAFTEESDSVTSKRGLKQLNDLFGTTEVPSHAMFAEVKVRKGLNFDEAENRSKFDAEVKALKDTLAKLEAEKEAELVKYQQTVERLSNLESEVLRAQNDSRELNERALRADAEVHSLKEALVKVEAEKESSLLQYQQCLERISNLENDLACAREDVVELNVRARKTESECQTLKENLARVEVEKEAGLDKYTSCLRTISELEHKLLLAEEDAGKTAERADKAEVEVEKLKQALASLTEEKEAAALQYKRCLERITVLEQEISHAQEEAQRLNSEIDIGVAKLKGVEEQCLLLEQSNHSLKSERDSLVLKLDTQDHELSEKQKELGRLWACVQEERFRFMEAETAFQTLQALHNKSQEELRSLAAELHSRVIVMKEMEVRNQGLQDEVQRAVEENKSLNELNLSSAVSMRNMQDEINNLREMKGKLEEEVDLRVDQRNALQQEIYCLKEELNGMNKKHLAMVEQVESVGLNPESFGACLNELQDENSKLKEINQRDKSEKLELLEKLKVMEELLEKNAALENSVSKLSAELEGVRGKLKALEESFQTLLEEKSTLVDEKASLAAQLRSTTENLGKLSENNTVLENSLSDAVAELEVLRIKSRSLEDTHQLLHNEKSGLITEKESLLSHLDITQEKLGNLEGRYNDLEDRYSDLEREKASTLCMVEQLQVSLDIEKQRYASLVQLNETQVAAMETQIHLLQEEGQCRMKELEEELNKSINSEIEIFVLRKCVEDLKQEKLTLLKECDDQLEASKLSEKLIAKLECKNHERESQVNSLSNQIKRLRMRMNEVLNALDISGNRGTENESEQDEVFVDCILGNLEEKKNTLSQILDDNYQLVIQKSVLITVLGQLRLEAVNLLVERNTLQLEIGMRADELLVLQNERRKLLEMNDVLGLKVSEGLHKAEALETELQNICGKLLDVEGAYHGLEEKNSKLIEEKMLLLKKLSDLVEEKNNLEEENCLLFGEAVTLGNLSLIFKNNIVEQSLELRELVENLDKLNGLNGILDEKVKSMEEKLEMVQMQNSDLKDSLEKSENELQAVRLVTDTLTCEIAEGKILFSQKETELLESTQKLNTIQEENAKLQCLVEELKRECEEVKVTREAQEKQVFKLSEDNNNHTVEIRCLHELNARLEDELSKLVKEHKETKNKEETLSSKLQKEREEVQLWETEAIKFFMELQKSTVQEALLAEKVHELTTACQCLEDKANSTDIDIELLKQKVSSVESDNGGLRAQLANYEGAIVSLSDCISSLEAQTLSRAEVENVNNEEPMDANLASKSLEESSQSLSEDQVSFVTNRCRTMQDLEAKVKEIEKSLIEKERHALQEKLSMKDELEAAVRQIEDLKIKTKPEKDLEIRLNDDPRLQKSTHEISVVGNGTLAKDIMLDQVSECSSYRVSKSEHAEVDNHMLESWEASDRGGSRGVPVRVPEKVAAKSSEKDAGYHQIYVPEEYKSYKSEYPSSEFQIEKELVIDRMEISRRFSRSSQEGNKEKTLERLDSDVQKLANLQIIVQDLKKKVEIMEKSKMRKGIEYDTVNEQLEEAEEAILKLFDTNGKLKKSIEDSSPPTDVKSSSASLDLDRSGSIRKRRVSEQARRVSEKIGRLQLEVQKLQFLLLKLDGENESRGRARATERKTRVLLRDYLYGGAKTAHRRTKTHFCGCVQPPTRGD